MTIRVSEFESIEAAGLRQLISKWLLAFAAIFVIGIMLHPDAEPPFGLDDRLAHFLLFYALAMLFLLSRAVLMIEVS